MVKIPSDIKDVVSKQAPLPIATADKNGIPNVVFVGMWKFLDDETILFVDNFFNKTEKNIKANPNMAIVAFDGAIGKSYQIKGTIEIETSGPMFDIATEMADAKKLPGKAAFVFKITEIYDATYGPDAGKKIA